VSVDISIRNAVKKFGNATIISGLSLDVRGGEFFTLLGPSGCGKTTLLRMIAGFNTIEGGDFLFGSQRINDLDPAGRNVGMVFQNYAIFPHMTVRKNVEFGLVNRGVPSAERTERSDRFMKLVHIDDFADRMPDRLSGGQQQRVALARALVIQPDVLLMDEPLSNLDAKLRVEMRSVIRNIQRSVGITTVYVTHDQEEAMAVSDRIAVMKDGEIQHVGSPGAIYHRPANLFVATFIGRANVMEAELKMREGVPGIVFPNGYSLVMEQICEEFREDRKVLVTVRPEEFTLSPAGGEKAGEREGIRAVVKDSVFLGLNTTYFVRLETGEDAEIIRESELNDALPPDTEILLKPNVRKFNVFTADGSRNILDGVRSDVTLPERGKAP
jgi:iron(III) transport system ATP-binding protein